MQICWLVFLLCKKEQNNKHIMSNIYKCGQVCTQFFGVPNVRINDELIRACASIKKGDYHEKAGKAVEKAHV